MKVARLLPFAAVAIALAAVLLAFASPEAVASIVALKAEVASRAGELATVHASAAILALRKEIADLSSAAATKLTEINDQLSPEQVRAIEADHAKMLADVEAKRASLATLEAEAARTTPAPTPDPIAAERVRAAEILDIGARAQMDREAIDTAVRNGQTVEAFRAVAFAHLADQTARNAPRSAIIRDERETKRTGMREAVSAALATSAGGRVDVSDNARRFMGWSLAEIAADIMGERSMPRTFADREAIFERAFHTTSDFPIIFGGAINSRLLASYEAAAPVYRQIAARTSFVDFRAHDQIRPGDFPMPVAVGQAGEIKFGTFGEKKETIAVAPYAVQFNLTRQMLVNDNLGAIDRVLSGYGTTIALFEDVTFFAMKGVASGAGPTLVETSRAVFNTTDGTLAASASAITTAAIGLGRAALRKMKRLDGNPMGLGPSIILVSPDKETEVETVLVQITPAQGSNANLFSGRLRPVVSAQLTGNAWELYTDLSVGANWSWGLLDGYTAPRLKLEEKFGVQGVGISLEHDFGCGAVDYRFGYRNAGA